MKIKNLFMLALCFISFESKLSANELCSVAGFTTIVVAGISVTSLVVGYIASECCVKYYPSDVNSDAESAGLLAQHARFGKYYRPIRVSLCCGIIGLVVALIGGGVTTMATCT